MYAAAWAKLAGKQVIELEPNASVQLQKRHERNSFLVERSWWKFLNHSERFREREAAAGAASGSVLCWLGSEVGVCTISMG